MIFLSILFVDKNNWENDQTLDLWVEGRILTIALHVFFLNPLCKKNT
jgi:hypothetical protein